MMKGAIFDVDGTLLDSMTMWYDVTERFFQQNHLILDEATALSFQEMTLEESLPFMIEHYGLKKTFDQLRAEFYKMVEEEYAFHIPLKPYAKEYLYKLKSEGVKLAIATSSYEYLCKSALQRLGVWELFDAIALSSQVGVNKTNPDVYLLAAQRIGVPPEECVVFEDILAGLEGAKKAGMQVVAVEDATNAHIRTALKANAHRYISSWKELL